MSFVIRNLTGSAVALDDLGITIAASADRDVTDLQPQDVALSTDLTTAIGAGTLAVLSPLDGVTVLNIADSTEVVQAHNDPHWGIRAGTLDQLDDVDLTGAADTFVLQQNGSGIYVPVAPGTLGGDINLGDLGDVDDATGHTANTVYVFKGDGTNLDVVDFTADADVIEGIQDLVGAMGVNGTDTTFVYTDAAGTIQWNVDDVFLRNTGDTLDSGILTIASGAAINVATGADLTIQDAPVNPTDAANKEYVDSVASGLDPKESVRYCTVSDIAGTYSAVGGTGGTGEFTAVDLTAAGPFDGLTAGALVVGDRILVKAQTDNLENGIYVVTTAGAAGVIERASDHDGSPANEVSGGNFTFVENGSTCANTGWVLQGDGILTLNTDPIVWVQFSESTSITAGIGISQGGNTLDLDVNDLTAATIATTDLVAFHDTDGVAEASGSITRNTTVANFLADLNIITGATQGGDLTASDGVLITAANDIQLDITNLGAQTITGADELVFDDGASGTHAKTTVTNFLADLDIVNGVAGTGIIVQTAADTYAARSIDVNGAGNLDGLAVTNGDGVAGNPTVGMDIQNLPVRSDAVDVVDRVAVWNSTTDANEYYTVGELAGAVASTNSFSTWASGGNNTGDASIVADSSSDTANIVGGVGINIDLTAASDTVTYSFTNAGMADTAVVLADTVPFFDTSNANEPEFRSWSDIIADLNITVGGVETVTASVDEDELGIVIGGTAADPTVGLDIVGLVDPDADLAATDEFAIHDKSEGTAGANRKITGQNVSDGVLSIAGLTGLTLTSIGGQEVLTIPDTTRANKVLSIETTAIAWSENRVGNNDWLQIGNANDADSGYIIPLNATIVKVTAHTENDNNNTKDIDLYIDAANNGAIATFTAVNGENEDSDVTLNIDVTAGQKLRLRGAATGGVVEDIVVTIWLKWRG